MAEAEIIPPPPADSVEAEPWTKLPAGDYGIVELFGHTTLVGRIEEVERFGSKMMAIQVLFAGQLLDAVYHGGAALYRFTPCSAEIAWKRHPDASRAYSLPAPIKAIVPPLLIGSNTASATTEDDLDF